MTYDHTADKAMALLWRELDDGHVIVVYPLFFGDASLSIGKLGSGMLDDQWIYEDRGRALREAAHWNPQEQPEPDGWTAHKASGRRRPDGDAAQEYVKDD